MDGILWTFLGNNTKHLPTTVSPPKALPESDADGIDGLQEPEPGVLPTNLCLLSDPALYLEVGTQMSRRKKCKFSFNPIYGQLIY